MAHHGLDPKVRGAWFAEQMVCIWRWRRDRIASELEIKGISSKDLRQESSHPGETVKSCGRLCWSFFLCSCKVWSMLLEKMRRWSSSLASRAPSCKVSRAQVPSGFKRNLDQLGSWSNMIQHGFEFAVCQHLFPESPTFGSFLLSSLFSRKATANDKNP